MWQRLSRAASKDGRSSFRLSAAILRWVFIDSKAPYAHPARRLLIEGVQVLALPACDLPARAFNRLQTAANTKAARVTRPSLLPSTRAWRIRASCAQGAGANLGASRGGRPVLWSQPMSWLLPTLMRPWAVPSFSSPFARPKPSAKHDMHKTLTGKFRECGVQ